QGHRRPRRRRDHGRVAGHHHPGRGARYGLHAALLGCGADALRVRPAQTTGGVSRRALVTLLLVAAGLLLPFALVGLWTQQVLLDRDRFTNLSYDLLDREAVRQGIADAVLTDVERTQPVPAATEPLIRSGVNA